MIKNSMKGNENKTERIRNYKNSSHSGQFKNKSYKIKKKNLLEVPGTLGLLRSMIAAR